MDLGWLTYTRKWTRSIFTVKIFPTQIRLICTFIYIWKQRWKAWLIFMCSDAHCEPMLASLHVMYIWMKFINVDFWVSLNWLLRFLNQKILGTEKKLFFQSFLIPLYHPSLTLYLYRTEFLRLHPCSRQLKISYQKAKRKKVSKVKNA